MGLLITTTVFLLAGPCSCLHEFHFVDQPKTRGEAVHYCRQKYTALATVGGPEDMERLRAAAGSGYTGQVWIGLSDPRKWLWVQEPREDFNFSSWHPGTPNNSREQKHLCIAFHRGFWRDDFCDVQRPFVCYNEKKAPHLSNHSIHGYTFINKLKTWGKAMHHCRKYHTHLTSVRNQQENSVLQQVIPKDQTAWIGLSRQTWTHWVDGKSTFRYWIDGHPLGKTGNCAASVIDTKHLGKWREKHCHEELHFMCHNNKTQLFNINLKALKSTISLNHPKVTKTILDLMMANVEKKGLIRDVRISWRKKPDENIFH